MRAIILDLLPALIALGGMGAIAWGAYMIYPPAGFITAGILLCAAAYLVDRAINPED